MLFRKQILKSLSGVCATRLLTVKNEVSVKPFEEIPGPRVYPLIGNILELKMFGGDLEMSSLEKFFANLHSKYGDLVKWTAFRRTQVFIFNPEYVKKVHQVDGLMPSRKGVRAWLFYYNKRGVPIPIFSSSNERWRKLRTAVNPIAVRPQTIHLYIDKNIEVVDEFIELIDRQLTVNDSKFLDFGKQLQHLSLELICLVALDNRLHCLDQTTCTESAKKLIESIETFFLYTAKLSYALPLWKFFETKDRKKFFESSDYTYNLISEYIKEASKRLTSELREQHFDELSILQQLILNRDKHKLTLEDIESIMVDFMMAGVDTTAMTLQYMITELSRHPDIQERLYDEIVKVIRPGEKLDKENVYKISYLKLVLKETLRYHNIVPALSRVLKEDLVLDGYHLPKGTCVNFVPIHITKNEKYFKDAAKFDPNRWSAENSAAIHPYAALPFGYGPRMCLGRRVSEQEIYVTIIKLLHKYKIEFIGEPFGFKYGIITVPDRPLDIRLTKRQ